MPGPAMAGLTALQWLQAGLAKAADRPLVQYRGTWHSGAEVHAGAMGYAAQMQAAGLSSGQCVWIIVTDNLTAMQMQLGAWLLGATSLLLDFRTTAHRFAQTQGQLVPDLVVSTRRVAAAQALNPILLTADPTQQFTPTPASADQTADYFATSGSTGLPKLTPTPQHRLGLRIGEMIDSTDRGAWGVALSALSVAYPASRAIWLRNLAAGVPIFALDLLHSLTDLDAALLQPDVDECTLPPAVIRRLAHLPQGPVPRYPQLKKLQSVGGPALAADKLLTVRHLTPAYLMTYSSTECGVISRITGAEVPDRPASCGRAVAGMQVSIQQAGQPCATGQTGAIVVTRPDRVVVQTGDIGWLDAAGYLYITGRVQGLLCRNGVNFSAERLTDAALLSPDVTDAVVIAMPGPDGGDQVHLLVECAKAAQAAVATTLRIHLPAAEQPDQIHFRRFLPRGPSGKIDRPQLQAELYEYGGKEQNHEH